MIAALICIQLFVLIGGGLAFSTQHNYTKSVHNLATVYYNTLHERTTALEKHIVTLGRAAAEDVKTLHDRISHLEKGIQP
jgi:hypothetical protein